MHTTQNPEALAHEGHGLNRSSSSESNTSGPLYPSLAGVPARVREIAALRGLGHSFREIAMLFDVTPQAVSLMLTRHRRRVADLKNAVELHELSARAVNALMRCGVQTPEQAIECNVLGRLRQERNCGRKTIEEIERWLSRGERQLLGPTKECPEKGRDPVRSGPSATQHIETAA